MCCVICDIHDRVCLKSGVTLESVKFYCGSCQVTIKLTVHVVQMKACKFVYKQIILNKIALHIICTLVNKLFIFFE
jgi:hypothetical protein